MTQKPVPEQAPDHPVKVEPAAGVAVSVTVVPLAMPAEQVTPQEIPAGEDVTDPLPVPARVTVKAGLTMIEIGLQDEEPTISTAQTPKVYVPATRGVPVSIPFRSTIMPIGGAPLANVSD